MAKRLRVSAGTYIVAVCVVVLLFSWVLNAGFIALLVPIAMYLALAQGWNLLGGFAGYLNLGIPTFFGMGAYGAAIAAANWHWPICIALGVGAGVAAIGSLIIGALSLRLRGAFFAIFTFITIFVLQAIASTVNITHGASGISLPPLGSLGYNTATRLWFDAFILLSLAATLMVWAVHRSRWGSALVAIREDEPAAEVLGIRTTRIKLLALIFSAVVAGLAGGFFAFQQQFIYPATTFTDTIALQVVLVAVAGGAGNWLGPVIGTPIVMGISAAMTLLVGSLVVFGNGIPVQLEAIIYGLMLVMVGMFLPDGLVGLVKRLRRLSPVQETSDPASVQG